MKIHAWCDEYRRYIHTGSGTLVIEPGEMCIVVVGDDDLKNRILAALQTNEPRRLDEEATKL